MNVADIMTAEVISVRADTKVGEIARLFREHQLSGLPVVDNDNVPIGIVTELDMITRHARPQMPVFLPLLGAYVPLNRKQYQESLRRIVGVVAEDVMTTPVNTITADQTLEDLATLMISNRSNPLPVVNDSGVMIGIVSRTDVLAVFENLDVQLEEELEEGDAERARRQIALRVEWALSGRIEQPDQWSGCFCVAFRPSSPHSIPTASTGFPTPDRG